jgi:hypothetical protein
MNPLAGNYCDPLRASRGLCDPLIAAIADLRTRLQAKYERHFPGQSARIRTALEEAESAAWCTPFPHLFLPDLAEVRLGGLSELEPALVRAA